MRYPHRDEFLAMSDEEQVKWMWADINWSHATENARMIDDYGEGDGYVAILGQEIVGFGADHDELIERLTRELDVHRCQLWLVGVCRSFTRLSSAL